jgi:hypothetical protein
MSAPELAPTLLEELLRRSDLDQRARAEVPGGGQDAFQHALAVDEDNAAWLEKLLDTVGWPGRSLVGEEGSHAAWLLAQHADRRPQLQQRCLELLEAAVAAGDASMATLAYLTDRVLLASGEEQVYGTQFTANDGRYVPCRLRDPEGVDDRRASAGLESLQNYLDGVLERYGPPAPAHVLCPTCRAEIEVWLPEMGSTSSAQCRVCGNVVTLRPSIPSTEE